GCWDRIEINDVAFVLATALDKEDDGSYRYSALIPLPGQMGGTQGGGGGTGGSGPYYIESEVGRNFSDAQNKLQKRMARNIFHDHRRVIVISEAIAEESLLPLFDR